MLRVVIDSGVLIAALISSKGAPAELLRAWLAMEFDLVVSPKLLAELKRVLTRPKFRPYCTEREVDEYIDLLFNLATVVADPEDVPTATPDPADDYLVALAKACGANWLVSGDQHLLVLHSVEPNVITPRNLVDHLQAD